MRRYGARHRWTRLDTFPPGMTPPRKVRVYHRADHFLLNWWDPGQGKNLSERVDGDLLAALVRARQIDDRLTAGRTAGAGKAGRVGHVDLVARYLADLTRRADAGEIAMSTAGRYRSALDHYLAYCGRPAVAKAYPVAAGADREFRLGLAAFLAGREVGGNGRAGAPARPMRGHAFVLDAVRGLFAWAADPDRGGLLPEGFRNPFLRAGEPRALFRGDPLADPDVTLPMAADFVRTCDDYELRLFAPVILFGLRASEPCFLFREHLAGDWLTVPNIPALDYQTKGRRDKRFPLAADLAPLWDGLRGQQPRGLLFVRRAVSDGRDTPPLFGAALNELIAEYGRRTQNVGPVDRRGRLRIRDRILHEAGGLRYDDIEAAFRRVAGRLGWPPAATLKDFRHLFATTLANASLPEGYRKYLLGHTPGRDAAVAYTHLNRLREKFEDVVRAEWGSVVAVVRFRLAVTG